MGSEEESLEQILAKLAEMDARMAKIEKYLERQKGFLGGLLFIGSCFAWVASNIKEWLK